MVWVVLTGIPWTDAPMIVIAPAVSAQKPPTGLSFVIPVHGLYNTPSAGHRPQGYRHSACHLDPRRNGVIATDLLQVTARNQENADNAHGLLRVICAVSEAVSGGGEQLQSPEPIVDLARRGTLENMHHNDHRHEAKDHTDER